MNEETKNKLKVKIIDFIGLTFIVFLPISLFICLDVIRFNLTATIPLDPIIMDTFLYTALITIFSGLSLWILLKNESWYNPWKISHNNFENDEEYKFGNITKEEDL